MSKEIWKDIPNLKGWYQVSSKGRIRSFRKANGIDGKRNNPINMNGAVDSYGYRVITITTNGHKTTKKLHRLVANTFIPNHKNKPQINHINGNRDDNMVSNLEWCTQSENMQHSYKDLEREPVIGNNILNEKDVREIRRHASQRGRFYGKEELANKYNVSKGTIQAVVNGRTWKHVK